MFSGSINRIRKTVSFRLALTYSAIFVLSSVILFLVTYWFLFLSIRDKDRESIHLEFHECAIQYQKGGIAALSAEVEFEKHVSGKNPFLVWLVGPQNNTLFLNMPDQFGHADFQELEERGVDSKDQWSYFTVKGNKDTLEITSEPLPDGSRLLIGKSIVTRTELLERFRTISVAIIFPVLLFGLAGGALLARQALRPIRHLTETVRSITTTGELGARVQMGQRDDELAELGTLLNAMLERIETLIEKLKGELDDVAHDLRTPIMRMRGMAEMALQSDDEIESLRCAVGTCIEESERLLTMATTLMDISVAEAGMMDLHLQAVNISNLIEDVGSLYAYVAEEKSISIHTSYPRELYVSVDRKRLQQAVANLLDNAIKYTPSGGKVDIRASKEQHVIVVTVRDTGIGIPPDEIRKIWDRLYRGDRSRSQEGFGLGLSLVRAIVQAHGGRVEVFSEPGAGSLFVLTLPE